MTGALQQFSREARPSRRLATAALRLAFVGMSLAQAAVALLVVALVLVLGGPQAGRSSPLGTVLVVLAFLQCLLGVAVPDALARSGSKGSVLSATLLAGVLLSTPVWFLMLALATGQSLPALALLLLAALTAYALGFGLTGRLAARTATSTKARVEEDNAEEKDR